MEPYSALVILLLLGMLGFFAGQALGRRGARAQAAVVFGSLIVYALNQWIQILPVIETMLFPWPFYIYLSNWALPCMGVLAGAALARTGERGYFVKRVVLLSILAALALLSTWFYVFPEIPPASKEPFPGPVCRQSDDSTCAPAAVATYMGLLDFAVTEYDAAQLALTRADEGTGAYGIYRALYILGRKANPRFHARVRKITFDELIARQDPYVIRIELRSGVDREQYNEPVRSWVPGIAHAIVYLGTSEDRVCIADPSSGRIEFWGRPEFEVMWDGYIFYLEENGQPVSAVKSPVPWLSDAQSPPG